MVDLLVPRLYERDIDVLLQEELIFNDAVNSILSDALNWVLRGAGFVHMKFSWERRKAAFSLEPTCERISAPAAPVKAATGAAKRLP